MDEKLLEEIFAECRNRYPEEACGFILGKVGAGLKPARTRIATSVIAATNIQNELHEQDPKRYPRDAKTAYVIDSKEMEIVAVDAKKSGLDIISMFHSHPEHDVYFSAEDKEMAAPWGEPLFPELSYLVVSVYAGEVKNASEFYWDRNSKDFTERKIL